MPKPKKHLFICANQRPEGHPRGSCAGSNGSLEVWSRFAELLTEKGMLDKIHISATRSCLGPCSLGPIVIVYPDNVWYGAVTTADVEEILNAHLIGGAPVSRLELKDEVFG